MLASLELCSQADSASVVDIWDSQDVFDSFDALEANSLMPKVTMLDPWYNKGFGGVDPNYDAFVSTLLARACAVSEHVYLWGFPEILARYVQHIPGSHQLVCWLTWYYKNNPSVIRGWRSSQNACLHIARPGARLFPEQFLSKTQREKLLEGKLRYIPGPTSVIESSLLTGFIGKDEQTGHPSQKPLAVYDKLLRMVASTGDLVFDPMCGSGTTGVIAKIRGFRAILSDMSPEYTAVARRRMQTNIIGLADKLDLFNNNPDKAAERRAIKAKRERKVVQLTFG